MRRLLPLILMAGLLVPASGCFKNQIIVEKKYNPSATKPDIEEGWRMHLIGLIALSDDIVLNKVCPSKTGGVVEVETTFLNGLLSNIVPLISFQTARVYCGNAASGEGAELTLDKDGRIVAVKALPKK